MAMSIFLTWTFFGTLILHGAKFRMLVTPALIRASAIFWAADSGVAIRAILTLLFFSVAILPMSSMVTFLIILPIFFLGDLNPVILSLALGIPISIIVIGIDISLFNRQQF